MAEKSISLYEEKLWFMIAEMHHELDQITKGIKKAEEAYQAETGREFNPDDFTIYNSSGLKLEKSRQNPDKVLKDVSDTVLESYNPGWKPSQKVLYALKANGPMSRLEIMEFIKLKEPKIAPIKMKKIQTNFYSLIRQKVVSSPEGYGGKVKILKEM